MKIGRLVRHKSWNWVGLVLERKEASKIPTLTYDQIRVRFAMPKGQGFGTPFYTTTLFEKEVEYLDEER